MLDFSGVNQLFSTSQLPWPPATPKLLGGYCCRCCLHWGYCQGAANWATAFLWREMFFFVFSNGIGIVYGMEMYGTSWDNRNLPGSKSEIHRIFLCIFHSRDLQMIQNRIRLGKNDVNWNISWNGQKIGDVSRWLPTRAMINLFASLKITPPSSWKVEGVDMIFVDASMGLTGNVLDVHRVWHEHFVCLNVQHLFFLFHQILWSQDCWISDFLAGIVVLTCVLKDM